MFLGVILYCFHPADAFSCSMIARTNGLFATEQQCRETITEEMIDLGERMRAITRAKCFELGKTV
jgi:hypothetical protein